MNIITFSKRLSNFVDAADVNGNIKNSRLNLQYLSQIDNTCIKAGITTGVVYPIVGGIFDSHKYNFLNPSQNIISEDNVSNGDRFIHSSDGIFCKYVAGQNTASHWNPSLTGSYFDGDLKKVKSLFYKTSSGNCYSGILTVGSLLNSGTKLYYGRGCGAAISITTPSGTSTVNSIEPSGAVYFGADSTNDISFYKNGTKILGSNYANTLLTGSDKIFLLNAVSNQALDDTYKFIIVTKDNISDVGIKVFSHDIFVAQRSIGRS